MVRRTLILAAAVVALAASTARADTASDPPRIVPWHMIGNIGVGMTRARVEYAYGVGRQSGYWSAIYPRGDGYLAVHYDAGLVVAIQTTSPRYRTAAGVGVGAKIPLGLCHATARGCEYRWNGFTYDARGHAWIALARHNGRLVEAHLDITRARVTRVLVEAAPE